MRGIAEWRIVDMSLQRFSVDELTAYQQTGLGDALDALHDIVGDDLEKLWDVEQDMMGSRQQDEGDA